MSERSDTSDMIDAAPSSFEDFYRAEQPRMVALALALTGVPEVARDIAQDGMVKAYRAWPSVAAMDRPGAWLRRVTINASMTWHRRNGREQRAHLRLGRPGVATNPEGEGARFWQAVRALPERQRAAVALYYLEDLPVGDVAAALDLPAGTVKSNLSRARATLAEVLGVSASGAGQPGGPRATDGDEAGRDVADRDAAERDVKGDR